jgi:hypothetical protein
MYVINIRYFLNNVYIFSGEKSQVSNDGFLKKKKFMPETSLRNFGKFFIALIASNTTKLSYTQLGSMRLPNAKCGA